MGKIEQVDKNFTVSTELTNSSVIRYDITKPPFCFYGLLPPTSKENLFHRLPNEVAVTVSPNVAMLAKLSAGGRVRFRTNSKYIAIEAVMGEIGRMSHFPLTGSAGFDLYLGNTHIKTFIPHYDFKDRIFSEVEVSEDFTKDYTINFPPYSQVKELYVILDKDARIEAPTPYKNDKPVVFYGSSITQGASCSRPGNAYQAIISRRLNLDYLNLGFSGSAKGEKEICDYIANLDMSAFVLDYDHNAPIDLLRATHQKFFEGIREKHKDIPIICVTMPIKPFNTTVLEERKNIIKATVETARANGDRLVSYIDMHGYLNEKGVHEESSVDNLHPNDLGFYFMAEAIGNVLKEYL